MSGGGGGGDDYTSKQKLAKVSKDISTTVWPVQCSNSSSSSNRLRTPCHAIARYVCGLVAAPGLRLSN